MKNSGMHDYLGSSEVRFSLVNTQNIQKTVEIETYKPCNAQVDQYH